MNYTRIFAVVTLVIVIVLAVASRHFRPQHAEPVPPAVSNGYVEPKFAAHGRLQVVEPKVAEDELAKPLENNCQKMAGVIADRDAPPRIKAMVMGRMSDLNCPNSRHAPSDHSEHHRHGEPSVVAQRRVKRHRPHRPRVESWRGSPPANIAPTFHSGSWHTCDTPGQPRC